MPKPYSVDLRKRVIEAIEAGASRREAAERFSIGVSTAITWMQHWRASGEIAPKPFGGSSSRLDDHAETLLGLIGERPDLTLDEVCDGLRERGIGGSRTAVWRFFDRHGISFKKKPARRRTGPRRRGRGSRGLEDGSAVA
jgi:transposase